MVNCWTVRNYAVQPSTRVSPMLFVHNPCRVFLFFASLFRNVVIVSRASFQWNDSKGLVWNGGCAQEAKHAFIWLIASYQCGSHFETNVLRYTRLTNAILKWFFSISHLSLLWCGVLFNKEEQKPSCVVLLANVHRVCSVYRKRILLGSPMAGALRINQVIICSFTSATIGTRVIICSF